MELCYEDIIEEDCLLLSDFVFFLLFVFIKCISSILLLNDMLMHKLEIQYKNRKKF